MALIKIRDLVKEYDGRQVLAGVNLDLCEGEVKVVMGPSGCGKTTLLRCLNRLVEPTSGTILMRDQDVTRPGVDVRALRQSIGFVFQQFALYRHLTVLENVTLGLRKLRGLSKAEALEKAMYVLSRLDMAAHASKYPSQISGGQKQRVAIARALAMDPSVVVFDEPTSALDPIMSREVATMIEALNADKVTMICVTHDLQLAQQLHERIVFLDQGVVRAEGSFDHLAHHCDDPQVRAFFRNEAKTGMSPFERDLLEQMPLILSGLGQTLQLTVIISVTGLLMGIAVFYLTLSQRAMVRRLTNAYISFFIGMPLIVLLFLMYYGLPQWGVHLSPFTVALIGFTLNVGAYNAAYLTTAYNGLDHHELEAARAQGFDHRQIFGLITLPQVLRLSVPALTNQVICNLKDSSVAFLIQYTEFFARVQELAATNFQFFKAYFFAALVYLSLVSVIVLAARALEKIVIIPGLQRA